MVRLLALKPKMAISVLILSSIAAACGRVKLARWRVLRCRFMLVSISILSPRALKACKATCLCCVCLMNALITKKMPARLCWGRLSQTQSLGGWTVSLKILNLTACQKILTILNRSLKKQLNVCLFWGQQGFKPSLMGLKVSPLMIAIS